MRGHISKTPPLIDSSDMYSIGGSLFGGWRTTAVGAADGVCNYISAYVKVIASSSGNASVPMSETLTVSGPE